MAAKQLVFSEDARRRLQKGVDTLANAVAARFPECAGASADAREGGAVHRCTIDLATGLAELSLPVVLTASVPAHESLADLRMRAHHVPLLALEREREVGERGVRRDRELPHRGICAVRQDVGALDRDGAGVRVDRQVEVRAGNERLRRVAPGAVVGHVVVALQPLGGPARRPVAHHERERRAAGDRRRADQLGR